MKLFYYLLFIASATVVLAQENKPFVLFNDGLTIYQEAALDSTNPLGGWRLLLNDGTVVPVLEIHSFQNSKGKFFRVFDRSIVTQRTGEGRISSFLGVANDLVFENSVQPSPYSVSEYFSKNEGPIVQINYENLYEAMADNNVSRSYLEMYDWLNYAKYGAIVVTAGFAAYDIPRYNGNHKTANGTIISGITTVVIGVVSYYFQGVLLEKAIVEYNK